ncbi:MAG: NAD(P)H-hydrate dehydratase [Thermoanaerobaculia bacterium]|nr:NAD(P)H-hydrate dehydratase [Thermoanaerobaculia bacterium]
MKIFTTEQIRAWDAYTIEHEPVASVELMNRAAQVFTEWFAGIYPDTERPVYIFAGTGNNGGDGVAVARLLHFKFYAVKVFVCDFSGKHSADFDAQIRYLPPHEAVTVHWLKDTAGLPEIPENALIIDALFGSGLTRPLTGEWAAVLEWLNRLPNEVIAIDLPSGLFADKRSDGPCIQADRTFSFETPKPVFFFPENAARVGEWAFGSIGLHPVYALETETPFHYVTGPEIQALVKPRPRFSHKGSYGHALLINGGYGKMGAAVLAARACLRAGVGLLTVHVPRCGYDILQVSAPEAMCSVDTHEAIWMTPPDQGRFTAVGAGCGIGTAPGTAAALENLLRQANVPLLLDADALNLLSEHPGWWKLIPENTVLTPHPKEFDRLFGDSGDSFDRFERQRGAAREYRVFIVLKGAFTTIACPDGTCYFNSTGNPGMATGGSGDVLTGMLTGLLAQGYTPREACLLGVYLHGLAGDLAAADLAQPGMTAGDLITYLPKAWKRVVK